MSKNFKNVESLLNGNWLLAPKYSGAIIPFIRELKNPLQHQSSSGEKESDPDMQISVIVMDISSDSEVSSFSKVSSTQFSGSQNQLGVAVIPYKEVVTKYGDWWSWGTNWLANRILELGMDNRIGAIVIEFDSPGGSANAVEFPAAAIAEVKSTKPVIAYVKAGIAASAAYWIASGCTSIYTSLPGDEVGSIGAYTTMINMEKFYSSWLETDVETIYSTKSPEKNKGYRDWTEGNTDWLIKNELDPLVDMFHQTVKENRPQVKDEALKGDMYNSERAIDMGLIDGVKSWNTLLEDIFSQINESQQSTNMFKLFGKKEAPKLHALLEKKSEEITPEMITEANSELSEQGLVISTEQDANANSQALESIQNSNSKLAATIKSIANAAGLNVADNGTITNAEGNEVTVAETVAALVTENSVLREKAGDISTTDTSEGEESAADKNQDDILAKMYDGIDEKVNSY